VRSWVLIATVALLACRAEEAVEPGPIDPWEAFAAPGDWTRAGPGASSRTFEPSELGVACGYVLGGPGDAEHHNLSVIYDGWLVHPWAPEEGGGGISFFDASDPCNPVLVGQTWSDTMRETHALAFGEAGERRFLAVDYHDSSTVGGVGFYDVTDPTAPQWVSELATPGYFYPDAYVRVTFGNFWQGPYVFAAAAFNGVHVVDATDPLDPQLVTTWTFDGPHLAANVTIIGNLGVVTAAGTSRVVLLDVSDPLAPQPIGDFAVQDADGETRTYYFASIVGRYGLFARKERGGGPILYDLSDPTAPQWVGAAHTPDGDGGYVYRNGERLLIGDSNFGSIYDISDPVHPVETLRISVQGDLDTISPIGNVALVSVDSKGAPGEATSVFPIEASPDMRPPVAELLSPFPDAESQALTSRVGVAFDEWIERASVHPGSFRVLGPDGPVDGMYNVQEAVVNFTPREPLREDSVYEIWLPQGGISDISGVAIAEEVKWTFTTAAP
jgi:hypothetical protein